MNALITSLLRKAAYLFAVIITLIASFIAFIYLASPILNQRRAEIENWATDLFKTPVSIQKVTLSWAGYQPEINLIGVTASSPATHQPVLAIKKVSIYVSIPQSILHLTIVPSGVLLSGSNINVAETPNGQYVLQGFPAFGSFNDEPFAAETSVPTMLTWLSLQPDITLDDIRLRYKQASGEVRIVSLSELSLENNGIRHTVLGKAQLQQTTPVDASIAVQWKGDSTDLAKMNARIYLYVTGVSLPQWLKDKEWKNWQIQKGVISAKIWLKWSDHAWQKIQTSFQALDIVTKAQSNSSIHTINRLSGDVGWRREGENWVIAGDNILVDLPTRLWPVSNFYLTLKPAPIPVKTAEADASASGEMPRDINPSLQMDGSIQSSAQHKRSEESATTKNAKLKSSVAVKYPSQAMQSALTQVKKIEEKDGVTATVPAKTVAPETVKAIEASGTTEGQWIPTVLNTGYINISDVLPLLFATPDLVPPALQTTLQELQLTGSIESLSLVFPPDLQDWQMTSLTTSLKDMTFVPVGKMPGVKNVSGKLIWRNGEGTFDLMSQGLSFQYDSIFANSIDLEQLTGQLQLKHDTQLSVWTISAPSLQLSNDDLSANIKTTFTFAAGQALPTINLTANYTLQTAQHITRYLPLKIFSPEVNEWLLKAFHTGSVSAGQAIVKGNLADFPFEHGGGQFTISGDIHDVDLMFADEWPDIKHINGKLIFQGVGMQADVTSGVTHGVSFGHVTADIPDFGAKPSMLNIKADPITSDFANALSYVHASPLEKSIGKMFGDVELTGPITIGLTLAIPLDDPDKTKVAGVIGIKDGAMTLAPWDLAITKLNGNVNFTEATTSATNVQGILFEKPLQFSLATIEQKNISVVRATFNNNLAIKDLENWLKIPMSNFIEGATDVKGQLDLMLDKPMNLQIQSNLVGIKANLPDQYGKLADQSVPFTATLIIDPAKPLKAQFVYGKSIGAALIISRDAKNKMALDGATVSIGSTQADWPATNGLYVTANVDTLDWDKVSTYRLTGSGSSRSVGGASTVSGHATSQISVNNNQPNLSSLSTDFLKEVKVKANRVNAFGQTLSNMTLEVRPQGAAWDVDIASNQLTGQLDVPMKFDASSTLTGTFSRIDIDTGSATSSNSHVEAASLPAMLIQSNSTFINKMEIGKVIVRTTPKAGGLSIDTFRVIARNVDLQASGEWNSGKSDSTSLHGEANSPSVHNLLMDLDFDARNLMAENGKLDFDLSWAGAPYAPQIAKMDGDARLNIGKGRIVDVGAANGAKMDLGRMLSLFSLQTIPRRLSLDFSDIFQKGYSFDSLKGDFKMDNGNIVTNNLRFEGPVARISIDGRIGLNQKDYNLVLGITPYVTSSIPVAATLLTGNPLIGLGVLAVNTVVGSQVSKVTTKYYGVTGPWNNPSWKAVSGP